MKPDGSHSASAHVCNRFGRHFTMLTTLAKASSSRRLVSLNNIKFMIANVCKCKLNFQITLAIFSVM